MSGDGNRRPQGISVTSVRLGVAERADIIIDFSKINASRVYLVNRLEQVNGRGPTGKILTPGTPIVQLNIGRAAPDYSRDPAAPNLGPFKIPDLPHAAFFSLFARTA